jgi:hypothetical protein
VNYFDPRGTEACDPDSTYYYVDGSYFGSLIPSGCGAGGLAGYFPDVGGVLSSAVAAAEAVAAAAEQQAAQPQCSISLYERPFNVAGISTPAVHTYIDATITVAGVTTQEIIDGGAVPGLSWTGLLLNGWINFGPTGHYAADNPSLASNDEIGSPYTGANACQDVQTITSETGTYTAGKLATYNPVPSFWVNGWNSNSFSYTLLNSVGLAFSFGSLPSWTPGWGYAVPGLTSAAP